MTIWNDPDHEEWFDVSRRTNAFVDRLIKRGDVIVAVSPDIRSEEEKKKRKRPPGVFYPTRARLHIDASQTLPKTLKELSTVNLSSKLSQRRYPAFTGVTVHESAHAKHTLHRAKHEDYFVNQWIAALEEPRCEHKMILEYPQYVPHLKSAAKYIFGPESFATPSLVATEDLTKRFEAARVAILLVGRADAGIFSQEEVAGVIALCKQTLGTHDFNALRAVWKDAFELDNEDAEALVALALRVQQIVDPAEEAESDAEDDESTPCGSPMPQDDEEDEEDSEDEDSDENDDDSDDSDDDSQDAEEESNEADSDSEESKDSEEDSNGSDENESDSEENSEDASGESKSDSEEKSDEEGSEGSESSESDSEGEPEDSEEGSESGSEGSDGEPNDEEGSEEGSGEAGEDSEEESEGSEGKGSPSDSEGSEGDSDEDSDGSEGEGDESDSEADTKGKSKGGKNSESSQNDSEDSGEDSEGSEGESSDSDAENSTGDSNGPDSGSESDSDGNEGQDSATNSNKPDESNGPAPEDELKGDEEQTRSPEKNKSKGSSDSGEDAESEEKTEESSDDIDASSADRDIKDINISDIINEAIHAVAKASDHGVNEAAQAGKPEAIEPKRNKQQEDLAQRKANNEAVGKIGVKSSGWGSAVPTIVSQDPSARDIARSRAISTAIEKAQFRDVHKTQLDSMVPPGRFNVRQAMRRSSQMAMKQEVTATPWRQTRRREIDNPPIKLAIASDISGSMDAWQREVSSFTWAFSQAVARLQGESAAVAWNADTYSLIKPKCAPSQIPVAKTCGGSTGLPGALRALDGLMDLSFSEGVRVLAVITDGELSPTYNQIQEVVTKLNNYGVKVLWILTDKNGWSPKHATVAVLNTPDEFGKIVGAKVIEALSKA